MSKKYYIQLSAAVLITLLMAAPVYAEGVSHSSDINLARGKLVTAQSPTEAIKVDQSLKQKERSLNPSDMIAQENARVQDVQSKGAAYNGVTVARVSFAGMKAVQTDSLKDIVKLVPGTKVTPEGLMEDMRALYDTGWFYDIDPVITRVPEGVQINYVVMENPTFNQLDVEGNTKMPTDKIRKLMGLEPGGILNVRKVNEGARKVEREYSQEGYILAKVSDIRMLEDGHLVLLINEGNVENFKVKGNTKTKDYVVIREMKLKKGQPFNAKSARRSMQRIYNLGYFEDVNIKLSPGQLPNGVVVEIAVAETSTGTFGVGVGYSNADGFLGMFNIGDKNLRGTGDKVNLRWEFGRDSETNRNFEISYTRPWIDKHGTSAGLSVYDMTNEYIDYDRDASEIARYYKKRKGLELVLSRPTNDDRVTNYLSLKHRDDSYVKPVSGYSKQYYDGIDKDLSYHPETIDSRRAENFGVTNSVGFDRILDTRDNVYDPREGKRISYGVEIAGIGGDFKYQKLSANWRYYFAVGKKSVFAWEIAAGYAHGDMPLSQRFAVGGSDTLRGYEDNQFRGNSMLRSSLEFRTPIIKKVQGVIFADTGYAWSKQYDEKNFRFSDMKYSVGLGIRVNSPLGPLRLDYGFPLRDGDGGKFHFSFGGQF